MPPYCDSNLRQFDQLFGLCIMSRRINERSRNTECTFLHRLGHERFHFFHFFRCRRAIDIAEHRFAHLAAPTYVPIFRGVPVCSRRLK